MVLQKVKHAWCGWERTSDQLQNKTQGTILLMVLKKDKN